MKPIEAIQVDISQISDKTLQKATSIAPAPKPDKPAPTETKIVKDVPPAPKVDDKINTAVNEPKPAPTAPEPKIEPPKPAPVKPAPPPPDDKALADLLKVVEPPLEKTPTPPEPKPDKPIEPKKPEKKKPELKLDEIAALLNKDKGERTAPAKPAKQTGTPDVAAKDAQGADAANAATIINALVSQVKGCFDVPPGARDANIAVRIHFLLNRDGSVNGQPEIQSMNSDPIFDATARAAVAAIMQCQAYKLPADQYDQWKENNLDFNPNLLFGT